MNNDTAHPIFRDLLNNITASYAEGVKQPPTDIAAGIVDAVRQATAKVTTPGDWPAPLPRYASAHSYPCHCGRVLDFRVDTHCPCVPPEERAARAAAILLSESAGEAFEICAVEIPHRCLGGEK